MNRPSENCFVIMPFGGNYDSYYKDLIAPAIRTIGLEPIRADEIYSNRAIIEDIFQQISSARIIIADVSGKNPNVNYELGVAHAFKKPVVIIASDINDVPFDYRHLRVIQYDVSQVHWAQNLSRTIENTCTQVLKDHPLEHLIDTNQEEKFINFLSRMQKSFDYILSKECIIVTDEIGNSEVTQNWNILAKTDVSHIYHKIILDRPSAIQISKVYDSLNGVNLDYIVEKSEVTMLNYFILFEYFIAAGETGQIILNFNVNGYLSELIKKSKTYIFHQSMKGGRPTFGRKKETYIFPNTRQFRALRGVVRKHPDKTEIGKVINSVQDNGQRLLIIEFNAHGSQDGNFCVELFI